MKSQKRQVLKAIQQLGHNVSAADIVVATGQSLHEVSLLLNEIAAETSATLYVNAGGKIIYKFQPNLQFSYLSSGAGRLATLLVSKIAPTFLFAFRISFGLTLLFSVTFILGLMLLMRSLLSVSSDTRADIPTTWIEFFRALGKLVSGNSRMWLQPAIDSRISSNCDDTLLAPPFNFLQRQSESNSSRGFLLDCYLFLFGPGNPNKELESESWRLIAHVIRLHKGLVLAEQFVPFTGRAPDDLRILFSILAKFDGRPMVSESGHFLYFFPTFVETASNHSEPLATSALLARYWQFIDIPNHALKPVIFLAAANLLGSAYFLCLILVIGGKHRFELSLFSFLSIYGILFLLIPALRWISIHFKNAAIERRNKIVQEYQEKLGRPSPDLLQRLDEAEQIRSRFKTKSLSQIIYRTDRDFLDQLNNPESSGITGSEPE
jgi:hypothetical protein